MSDFNACLLHAGKGQRAAEETGGEDETVERMREGGHVKNP